MSSRKFRKRGRDSAPYAIPSDWQASVWRGQKPMGKKFRKGVNGLPVTMRNYHYGQSIPPQPWRGDIGPNNPRALFGSRKRYKSRTFGNFRVLPKGPLNYGAYWKDKYPIREIPAPPPAGVIPDAHADSYYWGDMYTPGRGYAPGNDPAELMRFMAMNNGRLPGNPGPGMPPAAAMAPIVPGGPPAPPGPPPNFGPVGLPPGWRPPARQQPPNPFQPRPESKWEGRIKPSEQDLDQLSADFFDNDVKMSPAAAPSPSAPGLPVVDIEDLYDPPAPTPTIPGLQSSFVSAPDAVVSSSAYPRFSTDDDIEQRRQRWRDYHHQVTRDKIQQIKSKYGDDEKKMETKMQEAIKIHNTAIARVNSGAKDQSDPPDRASVYARAVRINKLDKFRSPVSDSLDGPPLVKSPDGEWVDKTDLLNGKDQYGTPTFPGPGFRIDPSTTAERKSSGGEPTWLQSMGTKARNGAVHVVNGAIGAVDATGRFIQQAHDSWQQMPPWEHYRDDTLYDPDYGWVEVSSGSTRREHKRGSVSQSENYSHLAATSPDPDSGFVYRPPPPHPGAPPPPPPILGHQAPAPARRPRRTADREISSQTDDTFVYHSGLPTGYRARGFGFQDQLRVTPGYSTGISDKPVAVSDLNILYLGRDLDRRSTQDAGRGGPGFTPPPLPTNAPTFADRIVSGVTPQMFNLKTGDFTPQNPRG